MADIDRLTEVIEPEAQALGFDLVRVKMIASEAGDGGQALQIMAEDPATGQMVIEQCAALSRRVSERLDEVSTPGIDRPLTRAKDFTAWAGHEAKIALTEKVQGHRNLRGPLVGIEGDMVTVADNRAGEVSFPRALIHSVKLVLTDALIAATQPLDTQGVEDVIETEEEESNS